MMLCVAITSILLSLVSSAFDFSWFKSTEYHQQNIDNIKTGGWRLCPDWNYEIYEEGAEEFDVEINLGLFSAATTSFTIPRARNNRFNFTAKCITIQVPLYWDGAYYTNNDSLKTINYFMARVYSMHNENNTLNNGAFWIIPGGPGGDGVGMYDTAIPWLNFINSTYDAYIPDHRGTGSSGNIKCPQTMDAKNCSRFLYNKFGNDTYQYNTKNAAIDMGYTIDLFNENMDAYNEKNTIIYGISYGTYYLNKYLQLFPDQVNATILDGICPPDKCRILTYDEKVNAVGLDFIEKCDANQFCREQFKDYSYSALNALQTVYEKAADNDDIMPCFTECNLELSTFKTQLFLLLANEYKRALIPPLIKRLIRCTVDDQQVIDNFANYISCTSPITPNTTSTKPWTTTPNTTFNGIWPTENNTLPGSNYTFTTYSPSKRDDNSTMSWLYNNIINSEMYWGIDPADPGPSVNKLNNLSATYYFAAGIDGAMREEWDVWNKYIPDDAYYLNYANPSIPMLILNGDLDPQTPVEWGIGSAMEYGASRNDDTPNEKNRYYYTIPWAPHFVWYRSAINNYSDYQIEYEKETETCGFYLIASFIDTKRNWVPDSSCIKWLSGIDWYGRDNITIQLSLKMFGTINMWEGGVNGTASPSMEPTKQPTSTPSQSPIDDSTDKASHVTIVFVVILSFIISNSLLL